MRLNTLCAVVCALMCAACTSPVDLDTPRTVTIDAPHVPLPESLRVRARSVSVEVRESDDTMWVVSANSAVYMTLDTTFHPPLTWCNGIVFADLARMTGTPIVRTVMIALDSLPAGNGGPLHGAQFRVVVARKNSTSVKVDTLIADSTAARLVAVYSADARLLTDSVFFHVRSLGSGADPGIDGKAIIRTAW